MSVIVDTSVWSLALRRIGKNERSRLGMSWRADRFSFV